MLTDIQVGQLLASSARCEKQNEAQNATLAQQNGVLASQNAKLEEQSSKLAEQSKKLDEMGGQIQGLVDSRARADGAITASRLILGGVLAVLLAVASWLLLGHLDHNDRIAANRAAIAQVQRDQERHETQPGHSGHTEIAGEVRELRVQVTGLDQRVGEIQADVRDLTRRPRR